MNLFYSPEDVEREWQRGTDADVQVSRQGSHPESALEWTDAEREAVDDKLATFTVKVEGEDMLAEGFLTDHAREWVVKRALDALAPFVMDRLADLEGRALAAEAARDGYKWEVEQARGRAQGLLGDLNAADSALAERDAAVARVQALVEALDSSGGASGDWSTAGAADAIRDALAGESDG